MRKIATLLYFTFIVSSVFAQEKVIFEDEEDDFGNVSANYLVVKSLTLSPGFEVSAATDGDWYAKAIDQEPQNLPPATNKNFTRSETAREAISDENEFSGADYTKKVTSFSYSDGLGRPIQGVTVKSSPSGVDIIQPFEYNTTTGIKEKSYLPYTESNSNPGGFISAAITNQGSFYTSGPSDVANDSKPYTFTDHEESPLLRTESIIGVGNDWHSVTRDVEYDYIINDGTQSGTDKVVKWTITGSDESSKPRRVLNTPYYYEEGELQIVQITNEQGIISQTITDERGLTIASRTKKGTEWVTTYKVYDGMGRLRFIVPPVLANEVTLSDAQANGLLFQYIYDERGRLIKERMPDTGWKYYCYDKWDRLAASQDAYQRTSYEWTVFKYDQHNRLIITGTYVLNMSQELMQTVTMTQTVRYETPSTSAIGYTNNNSWPTNLATNDILTITYYDNYDYVDNTGWDTEGIDFDFDADGLNIAQNTLGVKGLITGSKVKVLDSNPVKWLNTVTYYDKYYRSIQVVGENHLGGYDRISTEYNFVGEVLKTKLTHSDESTGTDLTYLQEYEYDDRGRILKTWNQIDSETKVLATTYDYNELGELIEKNLHSTDNGATFLQSLDYRYNIRGWMETINKPDLTSDGTGNEDNSDLFGAKYHYTNSNSVGGTTIPARYDGSLAALEWKNSNNGVTSFNQSIFGYQYDDLSRITLAKYATGTSSPFSGTSGHFDVNVGYEDDNGNIGSISRKENNTTIDNLDFRYVSNSNKVEGVYETASASKGYKYKNSNLTSGVEYEYEAETGNLTKDENRDISTTAIEYNHLQLVTSIHFDDGSEINYTYDAAGNRLSKSLEDADDNVLYKIDYVGLVEYRDDEIYQIFTDGGRAYKQNGNFHYEYMITDHQGNNRISFGILPERNVYSTTLESSPDQHFAVPSNVRQPTNNHTPNGTWSAHLNKAVGRTVGPAKVIEITAGDIVSLEAWGQFEANGGSALGTAHNIASILTSALGITSGGSPTEHSTLTSLINSPTGGMFVFNGGSGSSTPQAYLQWIYLDEDYSFINGGFDGLQSGITNYQHLQLDIPSSTLNQNGYLYVYVANETNYDMDVFFDDIQITHESSPTSYKVTQVNDYYPFGMLMATSWAEDGYLSPGLYYQSSYSVYDSLMGQYEFLARNYDPALGRFLAVDPAGQFMSGYVGMGNSPVMGIDPDGQIFLELGIFIAASGIFKGLFNQTEGEWSWKKFGKGFVEGSSMALGLTGSILAPGLPSILGVNGALAYGAIGGLTSFGSSALSSGGWSSSSGNGFKPNWKGALISGGITSVLSGLQGYQNAKYSNRNPWTGKPLEIGGPNNNFQKPTTIDPELDSWLNPTADGPIRLKDPHGSGVYGARRAGGRPHLGLDIAAEPGSGVYAPTDGVVTGYKGKYYRMDLIPRVSTSGVTKIRLLYVKSIRPIGTSFSVAKGQLIGSVDNLLNYYSGATSMINHIHVQVMASGLWVNPTPYFFEWASFSSPQYISNPEKYFNRLSR